MNLLYSFSKQVPFVSYCRQPRIWEVLLWHTGKDLPDHQSYARSARSVATLVIGGILYEQVPTLGYLKSYGNNNGAWVQVDNILYIRYYLPGEQGGYATSQDWMFYNKSLNVEISFTDGLFYRSADGTPYQTATLSDYSIQRKADDDYANPSFTSFTINVIKEKLIDLQLSMGLMRVRDRDNNSLDMQFIQKIIETIDTYKLTSKDPRSMFTSQVINQQYNRGDYLNTNGRIIMDEDTGKEFKKEAWGRCAAVPCDCLNGYAYTTELYRKYRASYGNCAVSKVEVEVENGWKEIPEGTTGQAGHWWPEGLIEYRSNGEPVNTMLYCIPNLIAHPPISGTAQPDLDATPRKLRVSGLFQEISTMREIFERLIVTYNQLSYNPFYFNIAEIQSELNALNGFEYGLFVDKPTDIYKVIGELQNGGKYGFKMVSYQGLFTIRVDNPGRPLAFTMPKTDVVNINSLSVEQSTASYVSNLIIGYNKNNTENTYTEYRDINREGEIKTAGIIEVQKVFNTMIATEEGAQYRFNAVADRYNGSKHTCAGIELRWFDKYKDLREYDRLRIDLAPLTNIKNWIITNVRVNFTKENVVIDVREE